MGNGFTDLQVDSSEVQVDVAIIGAGPAGLTAGYLLSKQGLNAIMRHMTGRNWEMPEPAVARVSVFAIRAERWTGKRSPAN